MREWRDIDGGGGGRWPGQNIVHNFQTVEEYQVYKVLGFKENVQVFYSILYTQLVLCLYTLFDAWYIHTIL